METTTPKRKMRIGRLTTEELAVKRRANKPLTEKRRRERINNYLDQLKHIVLRRTNREGADSSRLEKTDILEMTVKYLQDLPTVPERRINDRSQYREGFQACVSEVFRCLSYAPSVNNETKMQLYCHLSGVSGSSEMTSAHHLQPQHTHLSYQLPAASPASGSIRSISPIEKNDSGVDFNQSGTSTPFQSMHLVTRDFSDEHYSLGNLSGVGNSRPIHKPVSVRFGHSTPNRDMSRVDDMRAMELNMNSDIVDACDSTFVNNSVSNNYEETLRPKSTSDNSMWRPW